MNPLYYRGTDYITKVESDDCYEIDFSSLILLEVLGEGAFGKVYKAKLNDNKLSKEKDFIVAVKMLKGNFVCLKFPLIVNISIVPLVFQNKKSFR